MQKDRESTAAGGTREKASRFSISPCRSRLRQPNSTGSPIVKGSKQRDCCLDGFTDTMSNYLRSPTSPTQMHVSPLNSHPSTSSDDAQRCQEIGEAAHYAGFEAINAPSATGQGAILAVMFDRMKSGSLVNPLDFETWDALP
jgi:hypothetical protein